MLLENPEFCPKIQFSEEERNCEFEFEFFMPKIQFSEKERNCEFEFLCQKSMAYCDFITVCAIAKILVSLQSRLRTSVDTVTEEFS